MIAASLVDLDDQRRVVLRHTAAVSVCVWPKSQRTDAQICLLGMPSVLHAASTHCRKNSSPGCTCTGSGFEGGYPLTTSYSPSSRVGAVAEEVRRVPRPLGVLTRLAARVVDVHRRGLYVSRYRLNYSRRRRAAPRLVGEVAPPRPIVPPRPQAVDEEPVALYSVQDLVGENILVRAVALRAPPRAQLLLRACVQINQSAGVASMAWIFRVCLSLTDAP